MNDTPAKKKTGGWTAIKSHIKDWDATRLTALIKALYESSGDNKVFLEARFQADTGGGAALETYRKKIVEQFYPARGGFGKLKLGEARKAIRDFKNATGNMDGTIDLLLTYLETGNEFTRDFGDISGPFYDSLCSAMDELAALLRKEGPEAWIKASERLATLALKANGIGWGYGDHITGMVAGLEDEFEADA